MSSGKTEVVVIGGSSGSIPVIKGIIEALPADFAIPIVVIIHRLKNVESTLKAILSDTREIREPEDKEPILKGNIYLAPQNYHLLMEADHTFSMDYSELVNYSRPSIDVSFMSLADIYNSGVLGIVLTGANNDGAQGLKQILANGGRGIVQDPTTAEYPLMPQEAIKINPGAEIQTPENIVHILLSI